MYELNLFQEYQTLLDNSNKTDEPSGFTSKHHLSYKQNKLENCLNIKITSEEEKYVYLLKKLNEYQHFVSLVFISWYFLLKAMICTHS